MAGFCSRGSLASLYVTVAVTGLLAAPAKAADASSSAASEEIEEIVVTAERRTASVQDTPIAMSAVSGTELQKEHIVDFEQLITTLPNIEFSDQAGQARIFIRGIGVDSQAAGVDPRVAIYTDQVYNARIQGGFGTFFDIDRVEVLYGPQGTLYGRNATAGAINVISRDPGDHLNGYVTETFGNYGLVQTEGAVGGPLTDTISGRIAYQTIQHDGYGVDISTGGPADDENKRSVRGTLEFKPTDFATIVAKTEYEYEDDHSGDYHFIENEPGTELFSLTKGYSLPSNPRDVAGVQPEYRLNNLGTSIVATINLENFVLTSVTGFRHVLSDTLTNPDFTTSNYLIADYQERSDEVTQELRLTRSFGPVDTLIGTYYYHETNSEVTRAPINGIYFGITPPQMYQGENAGGTQHTDAYAVFTQETVHITDSLGLDLGGRYSSEKRDINQFFQFDLAHPYPPNNDAFFPGEATFATQGKTWSAFNPKVTLHYKITNDILTYVTYTTGFKSGGFNFAVIQPAFNPEKLVDYEAGVKANFLDHRLQLDLSAFDYKYSNLQVNVTNNLNQITLNAGGADLDGVEAQFTALPIEHFRVDLHAAWLDTRYTENMTEDPARPQLGVLNLAGNRLDYAPRWKIGGQLSYTIPTRIGSFTPRAEVSWTGQQYFSEFDVPWAQQSSYFLGNLYLDYDRGNGWYASAYVKNVANKLYAISGQTASLFEGPETIGQWGDPRTFGISITKTF